MKRTPSVYSISDAKISRVRAHLIDPGIKVIRYYSKPSLHIQEGDVVLVIEFDEVQHLERFLRKKEAMSYLQSTKRPMPEAAKTSPGNNKESIVNREFNPPTTEEYRELAKTYFQGGVCVVQTMTSDSLEWRCQECGELLGIIHGHRLAYTKNGASMPLFVGLPVQCVCDAPGCGAINRAEASSVISSPKKETYQKEASLLESVAHRREERRCREEERIKELYGKEDEVRRLEKHNSL